MDYLIETDFDLGGSSMQVTMPLHQGAPQYDVEPSLSGSMTVGATISVDPGTLNDKTQTPSSVDYQWQQSDDEVVWEDIVGETGEELVPDEDLIGKYIRRKEILKAVSI